jgi:hypothetical protein
MMMQDRLRGSSCRNIALVTALSLVLSACAMHWPWKRRPAPPPQPVQQVNIVSDASGPAATVLQYWDRNTLLLDLSGVGGEGGANITPIKALGWPIRLEFRVRPGTIGRLEVLGAQRVIFAVPAQGEPLLLKLTPKAYQADTAQITLRWSAAEDSAH